MLSITELYEIGEALANHPFLRHSKIGLLVLKEELDNVHFLELVAQNREVRIQAFTNFEQAITWLVMKEPLQQ